MAEIKYSPIGIIHSPYKEIEGMPLQPCGAIGVAGTVEINNVPPYGCLRKVSFRVSRLCLSPLRHLV
jgi:tRNA (Thr-GGU) A37 N-methylase